ncbi:hypothetical protein BS50DRAFT_637464 [Corynespora cassiicola Philippines]|uniref:Uncharacterized protein n=1 Tax=Corynespora cassiicola Philippines TaxID=1448308 RepID=A0A2T2NGM0_CORCC|nr:hypothetical protein BS50DRAFT_637464 [Corynespora cassiicola Philippines]
MIISEKVIGSDWASSHGLLPIYATNPGLGRFCMLPYELRLKIFRLVILNFVGNGSTIQWFGLLGVCMEIPTFFQASASLLAGGWKSLLASFELQVKSLNDCESLLEIADSDSPKYFASPELGIRFEYQLITKLSLIKMIDTRKRPHQSAYMALATKCVALTYLKIEIARQRDAIVTAQSPWGLSESMRVEIATALADQHELHRVFEIATLKKLVFVMHHGYQSQWNLVVGYLRWGFAVRKQQVDVHILDQDPGSANHL